MSLGLLLVGSTRPELRAAADLARGKGADVTFVHDAAEALDQARQRSADLILIEVAEDTAAFIAGLRERRIGTPVLACGIDAPASLAVAAVRAGARDYLPLPPDETLMAGALASIAMPPPYLPSADPALAHSELATMRASTAVLLRGEEGSGRETLARAAHAHAAGKRFLSVDCRQDTEWLEVELFGGSDATGAILGKLAAAERGTFFLRDVDALPRAMQDRVAAALRCCGGRIFASTGADVRELTRGGRFSARLLECFGAVHSLPPLRARAADLAPLASHFAKHYGHVEGLGVRTLSREALARLHDHDWPGNVGELQERIHKAVVLSHQPVLGPDAIDLPSRETLGVSGLIGRTVADVERELILQTLERCKGNRTSASTILGISVRTMRNKLRAFIEAGIPVAPAPSGVPDF